MWRWQQTVSLLVLVGLLGTVLSGGTPVRADEGLKVDIAQVGGSDFPRVQAIVSVSDGSTRPLIGLGAEHFRAFANERPVPIESVRPAVSSSIGIGVVLAIDVSGSMDGAPLAQAKVASQALVSQLARQDEVAVVAFSDSPLVSQDFTADREEAVLAIDSLAVVLEVGTALHDASVLSAELAAGSTLPRQLVVLLTDGQDQGGRSSLSRADAVAAVQSFGVPIFTIGLGDSIDRQYLEELAAATQAQVLLAPSPDELVALYQAVGELLRSQYIITIDVPRVQAMTLRLEVMVDGQSASAERPLPAAALASPQAFGSRPWLLVALVAAVVGLGAGGLGLVRLRRRRPSRPPEAVPEGSSAPSGRAPALVPSAPAPPLPERRQVLARLVLVDGTRENQVFDLDREPVTIGSDRGCDVVLQDPGGEVEPEQARIWLREDRFLLHHLLFRGRTAVAGRPVSWAVLENGDEIEIGPFQLRFELVSLVPSYP